MSSQTSSESAVLTTIRNSLMEYFKPLSDLRRLARSLAAHKPAQEVMTNALSDIRRDVNEVADRVALRATEEVRRELGRQESALREIASNISNLTSQVQLLEARLLMERASSTPLQNFLVPVFRSRELTPPDELTNTAAEIGVANIELVVRRIAESTHALPHLFGVNKGGAFLANYVAHRMDLHEKFLVKCDYRTDFNNIYCEDRDIQGPIVLIDDVSRSGTTLSKVKAFLEEKYLGSSIFTIVLVATHDASKCTLNGRRVINYSPWLTTSREVSLPWSRNQTLEIGSAEYFDDTEMDQLAGWLASDDNDSSENDASQT